MKVDIKDIKAKILQLAISGKLVDQDSEDESAEMLYKKIQEEKERLIKEKKIRRINLGEIKKEEIPFDIPDSWKWVRLGSINQLINGDRGKNYPNKSVLVDSGIPFINAGHLDKLKTFEGKNYITNERYNKLSNGKIELYDIIYCLRGSLGKNTINTSISKGAIASSLVLIRPYMKEVNISYLHSYLNSKLGKEMIEKYDNGTAQPNLSATSLRRFIIPLPPLNEQKRIVDKIDRLFSLIDNMAELKQDSIKTIDLLEEKVLELAIKGKLVEQDENDESANILYMKIQEEKKILIKEKKIRKVNLDEIKKEEMPFEIPASWKWTKLGDITYNYGNKIPDKKFSYIDVSTINNRSLEIIEDIPILNHTEAPSRARKKVGKGAVIYSTVRPYLRNIAIINRDFEFEPIASTAFSVFEESILLQNKYIYYYLQGTYFTKYVNDSMTGVAYPAVNNKDMNNALIPLPPLNEQKRIVANLDIIMNYLNKLRAQLGENK